MRLEQLRITRNRLENKGAIAISRVLEHMKTLKVLIIFQNGIKAEGMVELFKSFVSNPDLEEIRLNDNSMKGSADVFVTVLPKLVKLKILDVSDLLIGDDFSVKIFQTLKFLPELEEVYFNYNEVEKKAAQKQILEISLDLKLKVLEVKGNEISSAVWKEMKNKISGKIEKYAIYSDEEDHEDEEEDEDEKLGKEFESKVNVNK